MALPATYHVYEVCTDSKGVKLITSKDRDKGYYPRFPVGFTTLEEALEAIQDRGAKGEVYTVVPIYGK